MEQLVYIINFTEFHDCFHGLHAAVRGRVAALTIQPAFVPAFRETL